MNRCKVQEIAELITKGTTPTTLGFSYIDEGINFVKIESIDANGKFDKTKFAHISEECHVSLKRSKLQKNDILFSIAGAIGRTAIVSEDILPANTNQALAIIRLKKNNNDLNFIRYQLSSASVIKQTEKQKQGVAQLNLSLKDIGNLEINVPSLPDQQKIAALLDSIQSAIDNKKQQLQQLDELVKSKFVEMFGENPVESGKWKVEKLSSICKVQTGGTPSRMHPEYFEGNIPWITTANLGVNELNYDDAMEYITQEAVDNSATKIIPAHSLFIGIRVGVGKCSINNVDMCSNQDICGLSGFDVARTNLLFVKKVIDSYEDYFDNAKRGTTIKGVKSDTIKELKIFLPELELQTTFAEYVQKIDSAKSIIKTQLNDLNELLESKMDFYFGE